MNLRITSADRALLEHTIAKDPTEHANARTPCAEDDVRVWRTLAEQYTKAADILMKAEGHTAARELLLLLSTHTAACNGETDIAVATEENIGYGYPSGPTLSILQAARYVGISRSSVYDLIRQGGPRFDPSFPQPFNVTDRRRVISLAALNTWLTSKSAKRAKGSKP